MTIKDIAKAAGVSVSTVSKVLNHKDENITEETRKKVLAVVEENQFVPYAKIRSQLSVPQDKIGIIIPEVKTSFHSIFLETLTSLLNEKGYAPLLYTTGYRAEKEAEALRSFSEQKIPLVLMFPSDQDMIQKAASVLTSLTELLLLNYRSDQHSCSQYYCDYESGISLAMDYLFQKGSTRTGLLLQNGSTYVENSIKSGYQQALSSIIREYDESLIIYNHEQVYHDICILIDAGVDSFICQDIQCARQIYQAASSRFLSIPHDISVIALEDVSPLDGFTPELSTVSYQPEQLAHLAARYVITTLDPKTPNPVPSKIPVTGTLTDRSSIRQPDLDNDRILVIGHMNMDIVMQIPHSPKIGKPLSASRLNCLPGGKGANQAVAAAKLGGRASVIGTLGNDLYGKQIYENLMRTGVNTQGVSFHNNIPTGTAYISLLPDGNSLIIGNDGANELLDTTYIETHLPLFDDVSFCLLQMEMSIDAVTFILKTCHEKGIKTIVKPNAFNPLPQSLYSMVDILIPNGQELDALVPGDEKPEHKAQILLNRGFSCVIATLGEQGCIWASPGRTISFPAEKQRCADATGASDIFISCLTVMLSEDYDMETAVRMANYAAGLSIMWEGVQNAVPDRRMIENYFIH